MPKLPVRLLLLLCFLSGCVHQSSQNKAHDPQAIAAARIALGLAYLAQGDNVRAKQNIDRALEVMPDSLSAQLALTYYYEKVGEIDKTKRAFATALKRHPHSGDLLNNYGAFLCRQHQYADSLYYFDQALVTPNYLDLAATYENAALCAWQGNIDSKAQHYFIQAKHYLPQSERLARNFIRWTIETERWEEGQKAITDYQRQFGENRFSVEAQRTIDKGAHKS